MLLDAGCGSLLFTNEACKPDERGTVIGLDASIEMLGLARARTGLLAPRAALVKANVLRTPFRDGAFDAVICLHVAHVLSDLKGLVRETRWILKPGGKLFLTCVVVADPLALRVS